MRVTVCEMHDELEKVGHDWERLIAHAKNEASDLVLLPEMPFYYWFAASNVFDPAVWDSAVVAHEAWLARLAELAPAFVLGTRPINQSDQRLNEGFAWDVRAGYRPAHLKYYLPEDEGYWEATWYNRGKDDFTPIQCGEALVGFEICTEIWAMDQARSYGKAGVDLIVTPRCTGKDTVDKWLVGGQAAAVVSGAFSVSSNRVNSEPGAILFGGQGWVVDPDGRVLGLTSPEHPFVTVEIDLEQAKIAKKTYPRYVFF